MKRLILTAIIILIASPLRAQLNCSGGQFGCMQVANTSYGIGVAPNTINEVTIGGSFTGAGAAARGLSIVPTLNPAANGDSYGSLIQPTLTKAATGTHALFAGEAIYAPTITAGAAALTTAATFYVDGSPSLVGATPGYSVLVNAGTSRINGLLGIAMAPVRTLDVTGTIGTTSFVAINTSGTVGTALRSQGTIFLTGLSAEAVSANAVCQLNTGELTVNSAVQTCTVSSLRFKDWITDLTCREARRIVSKMRPAVFRDKGTTDDRFGFAAEWTAAVEPRLVKYERDGTTPRAVDYERYTAVLTKALQCAMK